MRTGGYSIKILINKKTWQPYRLPGFNVCQVYSLYTLTITPCNYYARISTNHHDPRHDDHPSHGARRAHHIPGAPRIHGAHTRYPSQDYYNESVQYN